jgi:hypothetical protein
MYFFEGLLPYTFSGSYDTMLMTLPPQISRGSHASITGNSKFKSKNVKWLLVWTGKWR